MGTDIFSSGIDFFPGQRLYSGGNFEWMVPDEENFSGSFLRICSLFAGTAVWQECDFCAIKSLFRYGLPRAFAVYFPQTTPTEERK